MRPAEAHGLLIDFTVYENGLSHWMPDCAHPAKTQAPLERLGDIEGRETIASCDGDEHAQTWSAEQDGYFAQLEGKHGRSKYKITALSSGEYVPELDCCIPVLA